ncbi:DivIVA domain-containing protein [Rathayibacter rathayi]|uniref:DivIVA domain-containing protein n=1 Tax=Rathayibacter rathayi TaxID=33887 RepID=A0ABD6W698_RATRA|nr:DivIVA domain-containing protein [Rathayibacter rathayi]AZZ48919.1 DivIVA domain-containing protein [Rathayibacter rathayi]MWV74018.1 DivIVA domain-containing protein [Rathayibacter rathayi NCPPB 2980 = VKM Ac-1601]PPF11702.1 DivIVA domain-containing protein [Rathayibacter rathayi]PPF24973.1 DivIVA domain-containing protein [Rathayibacter rathayi]PPF46276.1 DivIVA domain-containing protein [Rathayibacter rathayi]
MTAPFPRARESRLGYDMGEVDSFLASARVAYSQLSGGPADLRAADLRHTAFTLRKGGYSAPHVDAALERLEDAFAMRERQYAIAAHGEQAWLSDARASAQEIVNRLARAPRERFTRAGVLTTGYTIRQVDAFADRISGYFRDGSVLTVDDVRTVSFAPQRGGYAEPQVDLLLDTVVDVMLAVR